MKKTFYLAVCALFLVAMISGVAFSQATDPTQERQEITISGTLNDANQVVDDYGRIYQLADTEESKELASHVGKKVQIKGAVMEQEGEMVISVSDYELLKE